VLPKAMRYKERSVRTINLFLLFGQLTSVTLTNNFSNISLQTRPVEFILNNLNHLILPEVSSMHFRGEKIQEERMGNI